MSGQNPWAPLRTSSRGAAPVLPGPRGRYVLLLEPPIVQDLGNGAGPAGRVRFCHFSWRDSSFAIRDFIGGLERRQGPDLTAEAVWRSARERVPATGELFEPVENGVFWKQKLEQLTIDFHKKHA